MVADSETVTEGVYNEELNGNADEPAVKCSQRIGIENEKLYPTHLLISLLSQVILSSKMTLSLINLDPVDSNGDAGNGHTSDSDADADGSAESDVENDDEDHLIRNLHGDGINESDS